ncbi:hypothetical protein T440DRAFT_471599 [Plenodomus tracheiphilus IPT5]|uniref:N-terminal of MaoC-like dehydratase domain-containing protein n=1 Tax=Plenodomus tracheiphilus IPT5 TaxID=1408161 RepID=A0A6A7AX39_9PLEO|nr:hypothetical protein T440DRAFT_471599 [Plenodomus tracheiphilus IPT5]
MALPTRRLLSTHTTPPISAATACTELLTRYPPSTPISTRTQLLDANQLHLLHLTLSRTASPSPPPPPKNGSPIPPAHHLIYFTPAILESELGPDGTDRTVNPLRPFTRRMWAGGELTWSQSAPSLLRIGQTVRETTRLLSAEPKVPRHGGEMLIVRVEKSFENEGGVALVDRRSWVFQKEFSHEEPGRVVERPGERKELPGGQYTRNFCQSATMLWRFSALTFNAHKIHYLPEWCREVEGHRDAVVHGPLNLIHMLDFWRDTARGGDGEAVPRSIAYRAMSPLYVGEPYRLLLEDGVKDGTQEGSWKAEIWDSYGKQSMKGTIVD